MDRLFRKRTVSNAAQTQNQGPGEDKEKEKERERTVLKQRRRKVPDGPGATVKREGGQEVKRVAPPSLNVDIRNSLMLPGYVYRGCPALQSRHADQEEHQNSLSQRFSVLLPSLSAAPETDLRHLLATQRARPTGPSLTVEEEDLLFREMQESKEWDGRPPVVEFPSFSTDTESYLTASASSPSVLSTTSRGTETPRSGMLSSTSSSFSLASPPPTSTSMSSFRTFGSGVGNNEQNRESAGPVTRSYGFGGGSSLRDGEYIRKVKKSASGKNLHGYASPTSNGTPTKENIPLPNISPEVANAYYLQRTKREKRSDSPTSASDRAPTPTQPLRLDREPSLAPAVMLDLPTPTSDTSLDPSSTTSTSYTSITSSVGEEGKPQRKRQSLLAGFTPVQMKRISRALMEIGAELDKDHGGLPGMEETEHEELLEAEAEPSTVEKDEDGAVAPLSRRPSDARSTKSTRSETSSVFPFQTSPTSSAYIPHTTSFSGEPSPPPKLPPSPRSHNLLAHVEYDEPLPALVYPLISASRVPIHSPSLSSSSFSSQVSPMAGYVPGQPRPVGHSHHSTDSFSRSITPSQQSHSPPMGTSPSSFRRSRADSNPSPLSTMSGKGPPSVAPRTTSLARTRSVNQPTPTSTPVLNNSIPRNRTPVNEIPAPGILASRRRAGSLSSELNAPRRLSSPLAMHSPVPNNGTIEEGDETSGAEDSEESHFPVIQHVQGRKSVSSSVGSGDPQSASLAPHLANTKAQSIRGVIVHDQASPTNTLRRYASQGSMNSTFAEMESDDSFWHKLETHTSPADEFFGLNREEDGGDALRKMSGVGKEELMVIQRKLVVKANQEREAMRKDVDNSPTLPSSPQLLPAPTLATPIRAVTPIPARPESPPPTSWKFPTPTEQVSRNLTAATFLPPSETLPHSPPSSTDHHSSTSHVIPTRPAPPPPPSSRSQDPSPGGTEIFTPVSTESKGVGYTPPDLDPEKRRDFEARIAAATAALNRTPSASGNRLERKPTKKGPMKISSPLLLASSMTVETTPLSPSTEKALAKTSGSASKMSLRWKKFGFKKNNSVSGEEAVPLAYPTPPITTKKNVGLGLEGPIALKTAQGGSAPANMDAFRFPPNLGSGEVQSPPLTATPRMELERGAVEVKQLSNEDELAMAKFLEAGRAVGLDSERLNEMLKRSGTVASNRSYQSSTPTADPTPDLAVGNSGKLTPAAAVKVDQPEEKKGLFRSLSRNKKRPTTPVQQTAEPLVPVPELQPRNLVVRRTLLMPSEIDFTALASTGPSPSSSPPIAQRRPSVKRKPLVLTGADRELVSGSPRSHQRNLSIPEEGSIKSHSRDGDESGSSLYDLYHDNAEETLNSPGKRRQSTAANGESQAVEICEYADGQVVWNIVDALRTSTSGPVNSESDFDLTHSRNNSSVYDSTSRPGSMMNPETQESHAAGPWGKKGYATPALKFRTRDRSQAPRPETNVFFTSATDVADLIDHLSRDIDGSSKGRIDFGDLSPPLENPAFEDAPSPRKNPPPPISVQPQASSYIPAAGFSPKRQAFMRNQKQSNSPTAHSFASASSGAGRSVEDRLQALLDRLQEGGTGVGVGVTRGR
ncbi:hypothetical protein P7C73_g5353, partial [Tremellales sp. Uapishka_1]